MSGPLRTKLPGALRELRILFCQTGAGSAGCRSFVQTIYPAVKESNPDLPILIRQAQGTPARAFARFERGVEKQVSLADLKDGAEVERKIGSLLSA